jgi:hypothetical protein
MRQIYYIFVLFYFSSFGQNVESIKYNSEAKKLLEDVIKTMTSEKLVINETPTTLNLKKCFSETLGKEFDFSKGEINGIYTEIEKPILRKWTSDFFENHFVVDNKEIQIAFKNKQNELENFRNKYTEAVVEFSSPIFLRNYSVCILSCHLDYVYGGGYDFTFIFKKENGSWVKLGSGCKTYL